MNGSDGSYPSGLKADAKGNFYGTTDGGGTINACNGLGCGTVFELTPKQDGTWVQITLYAFTGGTDGSSPLANVVLDPGGNIYGTTYSGGDPTCGCGVVFELSPTSGGWNETTLYTFTGADGQYPEGGVILDANGNLYGTTLDGGLYYDGVVFELTQFSGGWKETILHSFSGASNGDGQGAAGLTFDGSGNLYGTTVIGGDPSCNSVHIGCGTVFELTFSGGIWTENVIYKFKGGSDGNDTSAGVVVDNNGNVFGTTSGSYDDGYGTVFELTPGSSGWTESVLYSFTGGNDGGHSYGGVILDGAGNLYGATYAGGTYGAGVIFELTPGASGWTESVLYDFTGGGDGGGPGSFGAGLLMDSSNNLYGGTGYGGSGFGVVFEVRGPGDPFLSFPLQKKHAFTANIISVFDHSSPAYQYCENDIVTAYDGEQGDYKDDGKPTTPYCATKKNNVLYGWSQEDGNRFVVNGHYIGDGNAYFLEYDAHPGFDFETVDQHRDGKIPVLAAADGKVICSNVPTKTNCEYIKTPDPCIEGPGEIKIKHSNGYFSIYLHLSSSLVKADEDVSSGQQIGVSGDTGVCGNPHLHFEIRKGPDGCGTEQGCICKREQTNTKSCIPVDPYGWWGAGNDSYKRATNINLWK